jgi:hypothetical protein
MKKTEHLDSTVSFLKLNNSVKLYFNSKRKYFFIDVIIEKKFENSFFLHINNLVSNLHTPVKILPRIDIAHNNNSFFRFTTENIKYDELMEIVFISKNNSNFISRYHIETIQDYPKIKTICNKFINFNFDFKKINYSIFDSFKIYFFKYFFKLSKNKFFLINETYNSKIIIYLKIVLSLVVVTFFSFKNIIYSKNNKYLKKRDTLAIIASGPSLNRLNKSDLNFINTSDTIGVNFAYMSNFKLDVLVLETTDWSRDFIYETFCHNSNSDNQPIVYIWDEFVFKFDLFSNLYKFPKLSIYTSYSYFGRTLKNYKFLISHFYKFFSKFNHSVSYGYLPLSLGIKHRYKEIRLYGFDLIEPGHWYDKKKFMYQKNLLQIRDKLEQEIFNIHSKNFKNVKTHPSIITGIRRPLNELNRLEIFEGLKIWADKCNVKILFKNNNKKNPLHNIFDSFD